jgi:hypothetical protein
MGPSRAAVLSWIEGFEVARDADRTSIAGDRPGDAVALALQLSEAALATRAPQMRARREEEDARTRETWRRLRTGLQR